MVSVRERERKRKREVREKENKEKKRVIKKKDRCRKQSFTALVILMIHNLWSRCDTKYQH